MLGRTFPQEFKHFRGLEQPCRVRQTERRVCMSILKHACKYLNCTEVSTWKDVSSFYLLISSIKQVLNFLGCIIFPDGMNYCGISGLSEVVQVTTALDQYLHSQSCVPHPMHSNNVYETRGVLLPEYRDSLKYKPTVHHFARAHTLSVYAILH